MRTRSFLLMLSLLAPALHAQQTLEARLPEKPARIFAGGALTLGVPVGAFGDYVDAGFGASGHAVFQLDDAGWLGLRMDGSALIYGSETSRVMLSPTVGGRIQVDLTTSNSILFLGAGPQIMAPRGWLRPYAYGTLGLGYFVTQSSLQGADGGETFAPTTNHDDLVFSYGGGTGLYIPLRGGPQPISLDLGVRYHRNGEAEYVQEGGIEDHPDGSITVNAVRSEADLVGIYLGVTVGLGRDRGRDRD